jgi:hypothetical protein
MKIFGASPLGGPETGIVRCKECDKAVLRSAMNEHAGAFYVHNAQRLRRRFWLNVVSHTLLLSLPHTPIPDPAGLAVQRTAV